MNAWRCGNGFRFRLRFQLRFRLRLWFRFKFRFWFWLRFRFRLGSVGRIKNAHNVEVLVRLGRLRRIVGNLRCRRLVFGRCVRQQIGKGIIKRQIFAWQIIEFQLVILRQIECRGEICCFGIVVGCRLQKRVNIKVVRGGIRLWRGGRRCYCRFDFGFFDFGRFFGFGFFGLRRGFFRRHLLFFRVFFIFGFYLFLCRFRFLNRFLFFRLFRLVFGRRIFLFFRFVFFFFRLVEVLRQFGGCFRNFFA